MPTLLANQIWVFESPRVVQRLQELLCLLLVITIMTTSVPQVTCHPDLGINVVSCKHVPWSLLMRVPAVAAMKILRIIIFEFFLGQL